jgi:hypothetical protein
MQWTITNRTYIFDFFVLILLKFLWIFQRIIKESIRIVQFLGLFGIALVGSSPVYTTYVSFELFEILSFNIQIWNWEQCLLFILYFHCVSLPDRICLPSRNSNIADETAWSHIPVITLSLFWGKCERLSRRLVPLKSTKASKFWPDSGYEVGRKLSSNSVEIEYYS